MSKLLRIVAYILAALLLFFTVVMFGAVTWIALLGRFEWELLLLLVYLAAPSLALLPAQLNYHAITPKWRLAALRLSRIGQFASVVTMLFLWVVIYYGAQPSQQAVAALAVALLYVIAIVFAQFFLHLPQKGVPADVFE